MHGPCGLQIDRALRSLAPGTVRTGCRRIDAADGASLHETERRLVMNAVPKRRHEFASGRVLLRELLDHTGPIGIEPGRAPSWPPGTRGSLAHDHHFAVAAVTFSPGIRALGIDIEPTTELPPEMADAILRPEERSLDAHVAFTLKEAAYKAWSSLGGRILEHHDMLLCARDGWFQARVVDDDVSFVGAFVTVGGRTVALVVVPAEDEA
jgi:4'-phosphopantetheinyl transferase EntD